MYCEVPLARYCSRGTSSISHSVSELHLERISCKSISIAILLKLLLHHSSIDLQARGLCDGMVRGSNAAAETSPQKGLTTPAKRRRASGRQTEQAIATLFDDTHHSNMAYIIAELNGSLSDLVPTLASWIRDGRLAKALQKKAVVTDPQWACTCKHVKQIGVLRLSQVLEKMAPNFFEGVPFVDREAFTDNTDEARDAAEKQHKSLVNIQHLLKFVTFALGCKDDAWLPDSHVQTSMDVFKNTYEVLGNRLSGKKLLNFDWPADGYFKQSSTDPRKIYLNHDSVKPNRFVEVGFTTELMEQIKDWTIENNWSITRATLVSPSSGFQQPLLHLFLKMHGDRDHVFYEMQSFEPDGVSPPACFKKKARAAKSESIVQKPLRKSRATPLASVPPRPLAATTGHVSANASPPRGSGARIAVAPK